jgi:hypothetical protein
MKALAIAQLTVSLCFAQQQYRFVPLTEGRAYRFATVTRLSDNGSAIGTVSSGRQPVVFSPELGVVAPTSVTSILDINASGDIVGTLDGTKAFVSRPPYDTPMNLNTVFGWFLGFADGINDQGDIIGNGLSSPTDGSGFAPSFTFDNWFPGLNVTSVDQINNAGQVLGVASDLTSSTYFLYTPGSGVKVLPVAPGVLNNNGDMLISNTDAQYIETDSGQIPLPSGYSWVSINDKNEAVGSATSAAPTGVITVTPVYFSAATGLVVLRRES